MSIRKFISDDDYAKLTSTPFEPTKSCFIACDTQTIKDGRCDCINSSKKFYTPNDDSESNSEDDLNE